MTTLYTPEDPSLLTSPALPLFQACINQVAQQALQSGMPEITVNAVFKHHQTCFDIALDALTQAFGPLHTRTDPSMTIRTNESAQTVFRREFHRAFHDIINEHRPDAEAEVQDGVQSDAETERFDENTPLPDGDGTSNIVSKEHGPEAEAQEDVPSDAEIERLDENTSLPDSDGTSNIVSKEYGPEAEAQEEVPSMQRLNDWMRTHPCLMMELPMSNKTPHSLPQSLNVPVTEP
jgi:hypothetical protein